MKTPTSQPTGSGREWSEDCTCITCIDSGYVLMFIPNSLSFFHLSGKNNYNKKL